MCSNIPAGGNSSTSKFSIDVPVSKTAAHCYFTLLSWHHIPACYKHRILREMNLTRDDLNALVIDLTELNSYEDNTALNGKTAQIAYVDSIIDDNCWLKTIYLAIDDVEYRRILGSISKLFGVFRNIQNLNAENRKLFAVTKELLETNDSNETKSIAAFFKTLANISKPKAVKRICELISYNCAKIDHMYQCTHD